MSNLTTQINAIEKALIHGDLSSLSEIDRLSYYNKVCDSLNLNPLTKPFDYIKLNNKLTLYATKSCTEQLRQIHNISLTISSREKIDSVYVVTAKAKTRDGREDESTGVVNTENLKGEALSNAMMKAETKAKRRVTLSICGLAMLDESEKDSITQTRNVFSPEDEFKRLEAKHNLFDPGEYIIPGGTFSGMKVKDVDPEELNTQIEKTIDLHTRKGRPLSVEAKKFIEHADEYLNKTYPDSYQSQLREK